MYVAIQTIDGKRYYSDPTSDDEIQAVIDNEYIHKPESIRPDKDQYLDKVEREFRDLRKLTYISLVIKGRTRYFNPENIIWMEIVR